MPPTHRLRRRTATWLAAATVALASSACVLATPGPTPVARGLEFRAGNQRYDAFFTELHDLQVELAEVPEKPKEVRSGLAEYLELDDRASMALVGRKLESEVERFNQAGTGFEFEIGGITGDGQPTVDGGVRGKPSEDAEAFYKAVRLSALAAARLEGQLLRVRTRLDDLESEIPELKRDVEKTFSGESPGRRADIANNLDDAKKLIPLMRDRADKVSTEAHSLGRRIEKAMDSMDRIQAPESVEVVEPKDPTPAPSDVEVVEPAGGGDEPKEAGGKTKPAPKPAPKPTPKPAPKPAPANPPPSDFEP